MHCTIIDRLIHVNNYIISNGRRTATDTKNWPLYFSYVIDVLFDKWPRLIELVDSKYGLLDELLSAGCITRRHKEWIEAAETNTQKNERLLYILQRRSVGDYEAFIRCLVKTKQHHVASLLATEADENIHPLNDTQKSRLIANQAALVSLIDSKHGLLAELFSADCITRRQKECIESAATQSDSNTILLEILARGSEFDFDKFADCLSKTGQPHVSRLLLEDVVVARLVARFSNVKYHRHELIYCRESTLLNNEKDNIQQHEEKLVEQFMNLLKHSDDKRKRELRDKVIEITAQLGDDVELLAINTQHSIGLLFLCKSFCGLRSLEMLFASGQLKTLISNMFSSFVYNPTVTFELLAWHIFDLVSGVKYYCSSLGLALFTQLYYLAQISEENEVEYNTILFAIETLPFELIEMIFWSAVSSHEQSNFGC